MGGHPSPEESCARSSRPRGSGSRCPEPAPAVRRDPRRRKTGGSGGKGRRWLTNRGCWTGCRAAPTVTQHLAAIRMLFDWLVSGHVMHLNPDVVRRRPEVCGEEGKDAGPIRCRIRPLLDSIDSSNVLGSRDRALIAVMCCSFARASAVVGYEPRRLRPAGRTVMESAAREERQVPRSPGPPQGGALSGRIPSARINCRGPQGAIISTYRRKDRATNDRRAAALPKAPSRREHRKHY